MNKIVLQELRDVSIFIIQLLKLTKGIRCFLKCILRQLGIKCVNDYFIRINFCEFRELGFSRRNPYAPCWEYPFFWVIDPPGYPLIFLYRIFGAPPPLDIRGNFLYRPLSWISDILNSGCTGYRGTDPFWKSQFDFFFRESLSKKLRIFDFAKISPNKERRLTHSIR